MKRTILVVGSSHGIGSALTKLLIRHDCNVIGISRTHSNVPENQQSFLSYTADIKNPDTLPIINEPLDGIAYCPGTITLKPFTRITTDDLLNDYEVNVLGAVRVAQKYLSNLKQGQSPSLLLFSSVAAQVGMPFHTSIAAAKGAVEGLARSLAAELAPTIRVCCIAPSLTQTPLAEKLLSTPDKVEQGNIRHPLKRIGQPADIAEMAAFLLSEKASWITGEVFHVDGGLKSVR